MVEHTYCTTVWPDNHFNASDRAHAKMRPQNDWLALSMDTIPMLWSENAKLMPTVKAFVSRVKERHTTLMNQVQLGKPFWRAKRMPCSQNGATGRSVLRERPQSLHKLRPIAAATHFKESATTNPPPPPGSLVGPTSRYSIATSRCFTKCGANKVPPNNEITGAPHSGTDTR